MSQTKTESEEKKKELKPGNYWLYYVELRSGELKKTTPDKEVLKFLAMNFYRFERIFDVKCDLMILSDKNFDSESVKTLVDAYKVAGYEGLNVEVSSNILLNHIALTNKEIYEKDEE